MIVCRCEMMLCVPPRVSCAQVPGSDLHDPKYVVNMANMVRYSRSRLVKCTIRDKYGKETARIMEVRRAVWGCWLVGSSRRSVSLV